MEWVETTAKTVEEAKDAALDRLGIGPDDAEFEVLEEPRTGLFGLRRGNARIRARVRPAAVRPKQDRRQRRRDGGRRERDGRGPGDSAGDGGRDTGRADARGDRRATGRATDRAGDGSTSDSGDATAAQSGAAAPAAGAADHGDGAGNGQARSRNRRRGGRGRGGAGRAGDHAGAISGAGASTDAAAEPTGAAKYGADERGADVDDNNSTDTSERAVATVAVADVQAAAESFGRGLLDAFGITGEVGTTVEGNDIELRLEPAEGASDGVGLLIGPGGRTLLAVQELARVAAQRRLGDHETRLRVDVAGYRERRRSALEKFAHHVADLVKESGVARSLDPMPSSDRKVIHDVLAEISGVTSRSEGEDPNRRIIVSPADVTG